MVAGMMVSLFIPAQAFSIKGSLDKAKTAIQRYWREHKVFRIAGGIGKGVAGLALLCWATEDFLYFQDSKVQKREIDNRETDHKNSGTRFVDSFFHLMYLSKNNPTCRDSDEIHFRRNPIYTRKYKECFGKLISKWLKTGEALDKAKGVARHRLYRNFLFSLFGSMSGFWLIYAGFKDLKKELLDAN